MPEQQEPVFRGTPGEWTHDEGWVGTTRGTCLCYTEDTHAGDEQEANGNLFAASKKLLAACQSFLARYDNNLVNADLLFSDVAKEARTAVAQALGAKIEN